MDAPVRRIWERFGRTRDSRLREWLIWWYLPRVPLTLQRFYPFQEGREEAESEGRMILITSVDNFDPRRGVNFSSYLIAGLKTRYQNYHLRHSRMMTGCPSPEAVGARRWLLEVPNWTNVGRLQDEPNGEGEGTIEEVIPGDDDGRYERRLLLEEVAGLLAHLSEDEARAVRLRILEGKLLKECVPLLGRCREVVRQREHRGLAKLRELAEELGWS